MKPVGIMILIMIMIMKSQPSYLIYVNSQESGWQGVLGIVDLSAYDIFVIRIGRVRLHCVGLLAVGIEKWHN